MTRSFLQFDKPGVASVQTETVSEPGPGQVGVRVSRSLISVGSELLVFSGNAPLGRQMDDAIASLQHNDAFPLRYGYACVGRVDSIGAGVESTAPGDHVFAFHPHASRIVTDAQDLLAIPSGIGDHRAVLYPNLETALTLVHDGAARRSDTLLVIGLGLVGQLVAMLAVPGARVFCVDADGARRAATERFLGGDVEIFEAVDDALAALGSAGVDNDNYPGFDVVIETTGNPAALNDAVGAAGFEGTIVVGSWYGVRTVALNLGDRFHRGRLSLVSSQVSTISGAIAPRWTRRRRTRTVWSLLGDERLERLATVTVPLKMAPALYTQLASGRRDAAAFTISYDEEAN